MYKIVILLVILFVPCSGLGQSLGEVARKERERREKNKNQGVEARQFSEGEIFGEEEEVDEESTEDPGVEGEGTANSGPLPERIDIELRPSSSQAIEDESRERKNKEAEFRSRYGTAKERLAAAREQKRVLDSLHLIEGMHYVDENGKVVIRSLDHLRRLVKEANEELAFAERALEDLEDEARRGGYPPGWLR